MQNKKKKTLNNTNKMCFFSLSFKDYPILNETASIYCVFILICQDFFIKTNFIVKFVLIEFQKEKLLRLI